MNIPLQIYDFIAILFPAIILSLLSRLEFKTLSIWQNTDTYGGIAVMLVILYMIGQVIALFSHKMEKWRIIAWIFKGELRKPDQNNIALNGRKTSVFFSKKVGEAILSALTEFYGFSVEKNDKELFELVYSPVYNRMSKREVFLTISNMMRSMVLICILCIVYSFIKNLFVGIVNNSISYIYIVVMFLSLVMMYAFVNIYKKVKLYSERIPYVAFLSWYRENILK